MQKAQEKPYKFSGVPVYRPGHFSDRTFFTTPVMTRLSSLLSVIYNIDSLFVCHNVIFHTCILSFVRESCHCAVWPNSQKDMTDNYRAVAVLRDVDAISRKNIDQRTDELTGVSLTLLAFTATLHTKNSASHTLLLPVWHAWNILLSYQ